MKTWATLPKSLLTAVVAVSVAGSCTLAGAAPAGLVPLKQLEARMLAREPMHEKHEARERHEELRKLVRKMMKKGLTQMNAPGLRRKPEVSKISRV